MEMKYIEHQADEGPQFSSQTCCCVSKHQQYNPSDRMVGLNHAQPTQPAFTHETMGAPIGRTLCYFVSNIQHQWEILSSR